jgi:hypothetical protein
MPNTHLQGTGKAVDIEDAKTAAKNGDIRLAVFLMGRYHGGELNELWKFVSDHIVRQDTPGAMRHIPENRQ